MLKMKSITFMDKNDHHFIPSAWLSFVKTGTFTVVRLVYVLPAIQSKTLWAAA